MKHVYKRACKVQLTQRFGLSNYRPGQKAAVYTLLSGRDLLCLLPTGAGKSLCWQLPAVVHPGLTVVVSPLIALMRDQVRQLTGHAIPAVAIDSLMPPEERASAMMRLRSGEVRIVFVSPERLKTSEFRALCMAMPPWLLVVDEAHCVVQWGREFRPAYDEIATFVAAMPVRPVLCAMTATADRAMQAQMMESLGLLHPRRVVLPVLRENLRYHTRTTIDKTQEIIRILTESEGKAVIFCRSRVRTEKLAERLQGYGFSAHCYHAGLDRAERGSVQQQFIDGQIRVLTATTAFGMGIDIPDVRLVIHDYLPDHVTDYVQQSGRAGRDRKWADCILLVDPAELMQHGWQMKVTARKQRKHPLRRYKSLAAIWRPWKQLLRVTMATPCIRQGIAGCFGRPGKPCGMCSACRNGRMLQRIPAIPWMEAWQLRAWLLRWQRSAIAAQRGVKPGEVLSNEGVREAARTFLLPENAGESARAMQPLLAYLQRCERYRRTQRGTE